MAVHIAAELMQAVVGMGELLLQVVVGKAAVHMMRGFEHMELFVVDIVFQLVIVVCPGTKPFLFVAVIYCGF